MIKSMEAKPLDTQFLPAEREDCGTIKQQNQKVAELVRNGQLLDDLPGLFVVVNDKRQIVFSNAALPRQMSKNALREVLGFRVGEALDCQHAFESTGGCGTTLFCSVCGAVEAILQSLGGKRVVGECRITLRDGHDALDLKVWATPHTIGNEKYSVIAIQDISNEKRRAALERIFFHDLINTAGGIKGLAEVVMESPDEIHHIKDHFHDLASRLIDEINAQKQLAAAERGDLAVFPTMVSSLALANDIARLYRNHAAGRDRRIVVAPDCEDVAFASDEVLVGRVLGNMVKNALEASAASQTVTINCRKSEDGIIFAVHNPAVMPQKIQLQIFQRSFSTKGHDRGLGTYSMKLLTEKYLKGRISFVSEENKGTTFVAWYPMILPLAIPPDDKPNFS